MGNELYSTILERLKPISHFFLRGSFNPERSELDLLDIDGNCTYNGYGIKCKTYGEIVVGFQTRLLPKR